MNGDPITAEADWATNAAYPWNPIQSADQITVAGLFATAQNQYLLVYTIFDNSAQVTYMGWNRVTVSNGIITLGPSLFVNMNITGWFYGLTGAGNFDIDASGHIFGTNATGTAFLQAFSRTVNWDTAALSTPAIYDISGTFGDVALVMPVNYQTVLIIMRPTISAPYPLSWGTVNPQTGATDTPHSFGTTINSLFPAVISDQLTYLKWTDFSSGSPMALLFDSVPGSPTTATVQTAVATNLPASVNTTLAGGALAAFGSDQFSGPVAFFPSFDISAALQVTQASSVVPPTGQTLLQTAGNFNFPLLAEPAAGWGSTLIWAYDTSGTQTYAYTVTQDSSGNPTATLERTYTNSTVRSMLTGSSTGLDWGYDQSGHFLMAVPVAVSSIYWPVLLWAGAVQMGGWTIGALGWGNPW